jgi:Omp85 superfamily domain
MDLLRGTPTAHRGAAAVIAAALSLSAPSEAQAQDRAPPPPAPPADEARGYAVPPGVEPEDVGLFLPRVIVFIPRMVLKAVFFPITKTLSVLDRHAVIERIEDVLYNDERTAAIVPALSISTFFGPTIGARAFHDDLAGHGERGSLDARFGGRYEQAYQAAFRADRTAGSRAWIESLARFEIEPSLPFYGLGDPDERDGGSGLDPREAAVETQLRQRRFLSLLRVGYTVGEPGDTLAKIGVTGTYNHREFGPGSGSGDEPSLETVYDTSRLVGWDRGVSVVELHANLIVDTRDVTGATSSGAYIELFGGGAPPIGDYQFWHWGGELTGYFDLYKQTRVLVVRAGLEGTEGDADDIPFSELPRLGGPARLRGYAPDRFRDEKAAIGTIEYHYPIHQYIAGSLYADVGSVARSYDAFFGDSTWRLGVGGGFLFRSKKSVILSVDIAYGDGVHVYATTNPLRLFSDRDTEL